MIFCNIEGWYLDWSGVLHNFKIIEHPSNLIWHLRISEMTTNNFISIVSLRVEGVSEFIPGKVVI